MGISLRDKNVILNKLRLQISKKFGRKPDGFSLEVAGEIEMGTCLGIFGPSGAGKTTLLRAIAGLDAVDQAEIELGEESWAKSATGFSKPVQERSIGFVFQDFALFPTMTVEENIAFGAGKGDTGYVNRLLERAGMGAYRGAKPPALSGGQQQRVALVRALARKPRLLLLDEPLSALDEEMRRSLQELLSSLQKELGFSTLLVSHDLPEIIRLCDQVWCLENGKITQKGSPEKVFGMEQGRNGFPAEIVTVSEIAPDGNQQVHALVGNKLISLMVPSEYKPEQGETIRIAWNEQGPYFAEMNS